MYIYICVCVYICIYVYMHIYVCVYIHRGIFGTACRPHVRRLLREWPKFWSRALARGQVCMCMYMYACIKIYNTNR